MPDTLRGDPTRVGQILGNLLGNAVKFTHQGRIRLRVEREPGSTPATLHFSIEDSGVGIPTDKLSSVFNSFTQADSSTTREYGGTGLGLAICRQLVEMMGGRIWAESRPGKGSTFHVTLTFDTPPSQMASEDAPQPPGQHSLPRRNILLAEDSKYNAFVIQTYLKDTPCSLTLVENGREALRAFEQNAFDIVFMDVQMPVMDGFDAMRAIRDMEERTDRNRTPIVAMTAYAQPEDAHRCREAGADHHLPKPVKKSDLFEIITAFTGGNSSLSAHSAADRPEDMDRIRSWLHKAFSASDAGDFADVAQAAQALAEMGETMGLPSLSGYGTALMDASEDRNHEATTRILASLSGYVDRMGIF
ncbi:ATP-binding protein [Pseudodesulfovibrio tunisiensis]|uniref:ATP-binding protein n=1 Tax=Pseudodesulfovibrio tunisiensis TaxID=463192 RepID=UPI001FB230FE|nr:ATP-binding protein [Pseudodesulfovibrio tunisiensis]